MDSKNGAVQRENFGKAIFAAAAAHSARKLGFYCFYVDFFVLVDAITWKQGLWFQKGW